MESRKRRKISNIIMAILIAVIVFCGIMAVGNIRGWFGGSDPDSQIRTGQIVGVANVERSGIGYGLKENVALQPQDIIETKIDSTAEMEIARKNQMVLNRETELSVLSAEKEKIHLELLAGEIFADIPDAGKSFTVDFSGNTAQITGTVFSISSQQGSASLNVLEGEVQVDLEDGTEKTVKAGEILSIAHNSDGKLAAEVSELQVSALNDFLIEHAKSCKAADDLCFTAEELQKTVKQRTAEKEKIQQEVAQQAEAIRTEAASKAANSETDQNKNTADTGQSKAVKSCTISIRCDSILNNMNKLESGKNRYVPANGCILATSTVEFKEGETVFDVLKRACSYAGIQLEYSYTPMYGSYYVEGINHLYEFDCGNESGWMYQVNGWFPNYGCSGYTLKNGDSIVWKYTCKGLGADVGGSVR